MKHKKFSDTGANGWYIGKFPEAAFYSEHVEACYRIEEIGKSQAHYHLTCTEIVFIITGTILCNNKKYFSGDILIFDPGDINDIEFVEPTTLMTIKTPAGGNDKVNV